MEDVLEILMSGSKRSKVSPGSNRKAAIERLIQRIRAYQVRNHFVDGGEGEFALSRTEQSVLIEFDTGADFLQSELADELRVEQTLIRRTIKQLVKRRFLAQGADPSDRRRVILTLTKQGRKALEPFDKIFDENTRNAIASFSTRERTFLRQFTIDMATGLGQKPARVRPNEEQLRGPLRQITRAFELVGNSPFFVTAVSPLEWHVLNDLAEVSSPIIARDLAKRYDTPKNTLSRAIAELVNRNYIKRSSREHDKRELSLEITTAGRGFIRGQMDEIVRRLEEALRDKSTEDIRLYSSMIGRWTGEIIEVSEMSMGESRERVIPARTETERAECREFAITEAVRQGKAALINPSVMAHHSFCFMRKVGESLTAVCEIHFSGNQWELINLFAIDRVSESQISSFVLTSVGLFRASTQTQKVSCSLKLLPGACRATVFSKVVAGEVGTVK